MTTDYEERFDQLETLVTYLADQNEKLGLRLDLLASENQFLTSRVMALETRLPPKIEGGRLPAIMSDLECQIFHTPPEMIPAKHKRVKTEWSLRLTAWVGGRRADPDINVKLYVGRKFYHQVMELSERPSYTEQAAIACENSDGLAGMLLAITKQKGRPYIKSQFCLMNGHLEDDPKVLVVVDGTEYFFETFRPAKGTKVGKAKWYAKLRP